MNKFLVYWLFLLAFLLGLLCFGQTDEYTAAISESTPIERIKSLEDYLKKFSDSKFHKYVYANLALNYKQIGKFKETVLNTMNATKAAVEEGIVPGGGVALLRCQKALQGLNLDGDMQIGVSIVKRAIEEPLRQIADNAGYEGSIVVEKVKEMDQDMGFNVPIEKYEDLVKSGILDPTKVVRIALQNASSISGLLLTTEGLVSEIPEKEKAPIYPPPSDMY